MHNMFGERLITTETFHQLKLADVDEEGIELEVESCTAG